MSEYLEAVSRLNAAGERPPGDNRNYYFPYNVHKYDNASWYNRVMKETGMTKAPRYAIEQRLDSGKAIMTMNNRKYFNLDPSFTFAHGTRKSIGLRGISVRDKYLGTTMCLHLFITYTTKTDEIKTLEIEAEDTPRSQEDLNRLLTTLRGAITNEIAKKEPDIDSFYMNYYKAEERLDITVYRSLKETSSIKEITNISISYNNTIKDKLFCMYYNIKPENMHDKDNTLTIENAFHIDVNNSNLVFRASFVDYTTDNYLGEPDKDYSLVNKIYDYREQCPQVWIEVYDKRDNPINFEEVEVTAEGSKKIIKAGNSYVVELSLICDTNNNILKDY